MAVVETSAKRFTVNGKLVELTGDESRPLLFALRDELDLTGSKYGCGQGDCGACTVLVDGAATRSCVTPVRSVAGKKITTIEGLEQNGVLHPVQQAFLEQDAFQCGYCTSGMIMSAAGLLNKNPKPAEADIRRVMNGNICRCGTYPRIVAAVQMAARMERSGHGK